MSEMPTEAEMCACRDPRRHRFRQPLDDRERQLGGGGGLVAGALDDGELVAAEARDEVVRPDQVGQDAGRLNEQVVAGGVAEARR